MPQAGDTAIVTAGNVQLSDDAKLEDNIVEIGGTFGATLTFAGDLGIGYTLPSIDPASLIETMVPGQSGTVSATVDATGMFVNQGSILANGTAGSALTLAISGVTLNGTFQPGYAINDGLIAATAGNIVTIAVGANAAFFNAGTIVADGGTVLISAAASALAGGFIGVRGFYDIEGGGTIVTGEFTPASDGNNTTHEDYAFVDSTSGNTLKILDVASFGGAIRGFAAGDTIDLGGSFAIGTITYASTTGLLSLEAANGTTLASLLLGNASPIADGTFTLSAGSADGLNFATGADGDTVITTGGTLVDASGVSGTWQSASSWQGDAVPGGAAAPQIGIGATAPFTLTTGSSAVSAPGVSVRSVFATLQITSTMNLGDDQISDFAGTVEVASGGTLIAGAVQLYTPQSSFTLAAGATADLTGRPNLDVEPVNGVWSLQPGENPYAFSASAGTTVIDGTLLAGPNGSSRGGSIAIGYDSDDPSATMIVNAGATVTATHGLLGSDATSAGTLVIDGGTWSDLIDNADTYNSRGYMTVGYNDDDDVLPTGVTPPPPVGAAQLTVENDGTLIDTHAYIGSGPGSEGNVTVQSGGVWDIGLAAGGYLDVGDGGSATLTITSGGTVAVGNTGTFIGNGVVSTGGGIGVGYAAGGPGTITVTGAGSFLRDLGGMSVGRGSTGVFAVLNGGSASIGTGGLDLGVAAGTGGTVVVSGSDSRLVNTSTSSSIILGDAAGGSGTLLVQDGGSVFSNVNFDLGGSASGPLSGADGDMSVTGASEAQATNLFIWSGSTIAVDGSSGVDLGSSGSTVAGAILVESGREIFGEGLVAANVVNNGAIRVSNSATLANSSGGTLEIQGSVTGTGAITIAANARLQLDGALGSSEAIDFTGSSARLILENPGTSLPNAINNVQTYDRIEFGAGMTIDSAVLNGTVATVDYHNASGQAGTYILSDFNAVAVANAGFITGVDSSTGLSYIEYSGPAFDWTGNGDTNFGNAANWDDITAGQTPAATAPGSAALARFVTNGGTITGTGTVYQIEFEGNSAWVMSGATLSDSNLYVYEGVAEIANAGTLLSNSAYVGTANATLEVNGTGSTLDVFGQVAVGPSVTGDLLVANGGSAIVASAVIGGAGASGTIQVDGVASDLTATSYIELIGSGSGSGTLEATNGGSIQASSLFLLPGNTVSVDTASRIEIGLTGTASAGAITVDSSGGGIHGAGTIAGPLVNNGYVFAANEGSGRTLEVTGPITGQGVLEIENGLTYTSGTYSYGPAGALQLDSAVGSGQTVEIFSGWSGGAPTLILDDPIAFAGTLSGFDVIGEMLVLPGQTVASASVGANGTLTITLAGGGTLAFQTSNMPVSTYLQASGSIITVAAPPVWSWTGAVDTNFANAGNWYDTTDDIPAASAPPAAVYAEFASGGGTITGTGDPAQLQFGGPAPWVLGSGANLSSGQGIDNNGTVTIGAGATLAVSSWATIAGTGGATANLAVSGAGAAFSATDYIDLGETGNGILSALNGGSVTAGVLYMGGSGFAGFVTVDALSRIEVGTAGTGAAGALTVDPYNGTIFPVVYGVGTISANLVNNGEVDAEGETSGGTLEIAGSVSGNGWFYIDSGYTTTIGTTVAILPGGILQFDSAVGPSSAVSFDYSSSPAEAGTLRLLDPTGFDGAIYNFSSAGDTLALPGETLTAATINNSTLTVTLAAGGTQSFTVYGASPSMMLGVSGSVVSIEAIPIEVWTGAAGSSFANPLNWDDTTDAINPAAFAPSATVAAEFTTGGGTVTGAGAAQQLQFGGSGAWVLSGASLSSTGGFVDYGTVTLQQGASIADSGSATIYGTSGVAVTLTVTGAASGLVESQTMYLGASGAGGSLYALNGGSVVVANELYMGESGIPAVVSVDATSRIEIGSAGTGAAGALTVDAYNGTVFPQFSGVGRIIGNVVDNGDIYVSAQATDGTLEVTGSVTGDGWFYLETGFSYTNGATLTTAPGGVLQFDSSVGTATTVQFFTPAVAAEAGTLRLLDPAGFHGTLENFSSPGDTLQLVGQTLTAASINASTLTVTLAAGGTLAFNLEFPATNLGLQVSGSDVTMVAPPTEVWTGALNSSFANAANWNDITDGVNPATFAPSAMVTAEFTTGGGTVTGSGAAEQLQFGGSGAWVLSGASLSSTGGFVDYGTVTLQQGASITDSGSATIYGTSGVAVPLTVTGPGSELDESQTMYLGESGAGGSLYALNGGSVVVANELYMGESGIPAVVSVDATSRIEIGTAGTGAAGALTVDAYNGTVFPQFGGVGTIVGNVVDNGVISAFGEAADGTLEVTGSVTGDGSFNIDDGYSFTNGTTVSGGVLQFDSSVGTNTTVEFFSPEVAAEAGKLRLLDPSAFQGWLLNFSSPGDTIELVGETVTGASITSPLMGISSTLTVTLAAGGTLAFNLETSPGNLGLSVSGSDVTLVGPPTETWTGASNTGFANPTNWNDIADGLNPANFAPNATVIAEFMSGGGTVSGSGSAAQLLFGGTSPWTVTGDLSVASGGSLTDTGTLAVGAGGTIDMNKDAVFVAGTATGTANLSVTGTAALTDASALTIGQTGNGTLAVLNGGSVEALSLTLGSPGFSGMISVDATSRLEFGTAGTGAAGALTVDPFNDSASYSQSVGGDGTIAANVVDNGSINAWAQSGNDTLEITGSITGTGWLYADAGYYFSPVSYSAGSILQLDSAVGSGNTVNFAPASGAAAAATVRLLQPVLFSGTLDSFDSAGDTLTLVGEMVTAATIDNGSLRVTLEGGATQSFRLADTSNATPLLVNGSDIVVASSTAPCYHRGTRIATPGGEVLVEDLRQGDLVLTLSGAALPVRWIGRRSIDCRRHPKPEKVWPVRVLAGAFGPQQPKRDLLLSPDHAVFAENVLIPVKYLVNGKTILSEERPVVHYLHVELDTHEVIFADGLACETYLDTGDRSNFENGGLPIAIYPDFSVHVWAADSYAPLCVVGPEVDAVRARLGHPDTWRRVCGMRAEAAA